ncbi:MAG: DUF2892 domain-containing protein [Verrucomicrobia bacterium]|nr:DUF2892 domain-containing protein [Verrucomicrobiota bacterium]
MKNIGKRDRLIRLGIAVALLAYAYWRGSWLALAASAFVFFEAAASWCIFYQLIGKNSCPIKKK